MGRPVEELARITPRICGVCPEAHHMAATKAIDDVFGVELAPTGAQAPRAALQRLLRHRPHHPLLRPRRPRLHHGPRLRPGQAQHPRRHQQGRPRDRRRGHQAARRRRRADQHDRRQADPPGLRPAGRREPGHHGRAARPHGADHRRAGRVRQVHHEAVQRRGAGQQRLRRAHQERRLHPRDLLHGSGRREQQGQLLRRQGARGRPRRRRAREVRRQGLPRRTSPSTSSPTATWSTPTSRRWAGRASSTARTRASTGPRR